MRLVNGPCAGQELGAVPPRHGTGRYGVEPVDVIWVCRPVVDGGFGSAVMPGPWFEYLWNPITERYVFGGRSCVGVR